MGPWGSSGLHLKPTGLLYVVIFEFHASPPASREELSNESGQSQYRIKLIVSIHHVEGKHFSAGHTMTGLKVATGCIKSHESHYNMSYCYV